MHSSKRLDEEFVRVVGQLPHMPDWYWPGVLQHLDIPGGQVPEYGSREGRIIDPVKVTFDHWMCKSKLLEKLTVFLNVLGSFNSNILGISILDVCYLTSEVFATLNPWQWVSIKVDWSRRPLQFFSAENNTFGFAFHRVLIGAESNLMFSCIFFSQA